MAGDYALVAGELGAAHAVMRRLRGSNPKDKKLLGEAESLGAFVGFVFGEAADYAFAGEVVDDADGEVAGGDGEGGPRRR